MRVNVAIGSADWNWIGGRLTRELVARLPRYGIEATVNGPQADLEYYQFVYGPPERQPSIGVFTHGWDRPHKFGKDFTGTIVFNSEMQRFLEEVGVQNSVIIELPVDSSFIKTPIVFGVAGRVYADGRKGEELVRQMVDAGYAVRAWGHGWPCEIVSDRVEDLPDFYRSLDYYIDTSHDEGGCVPALECLAMGVPVISHTVGVNRPVLAYERSDWNSLQRVLWRLTHPPTYDDWAREHAAYFTRVLKGAS